jgi:hypothetical protein
MPYKDKQKQKEYLAAHYKDNKEKYKKSSQQSREQRKEMIREAKNFPCQDCGIKYPPYVMQFDHVRGNKKFTIAGIASQGGYGSLEELLTEIAKCDIVCANCHMERTHGKITK